MFGDRSQIRLVSRDRIAAAGAQWTRSFYRNLAYRCGRRGHYTFVVVEREDVAGRPTPLWVFLHGGSVGYYDDAGVYHGAEGLNDEESAAALSGHLTGGVTQSGTQDNALGRRIADGYRFLVPSMCDHDLYAGFGNVYPNNPNWPDAGGDRVEGYLATEAAIHFVATSAGADGGVAWPTTLVLLHGASAGSAGAWHVGFGMARSGIRLNGALLDSYLVTPRIRPLVAAGCTPLNQDPAFDVSAVEAKIGVFLTDESLYLENNLPPPFAVFDLVGAVDGFCCGQYAAVPDAVDAGFANNCRWVHDALASRLPALGDAGVGVVSHVAPSLGHVIANDPGPHQQLLETWFQGVLSRSPSPPVFPP